MPNVDDMVEIAILGIEVKLGKGRAKPGTGNLPASMELPEVVGPAAGLNLEQMWL
jgi:hypothetical protein